MTPTTITELLWTEGFFQTEKPLAEVQIAISEKGCTFPTSSIISALNRAKYLTRILSKGNIAYTQRMPFILSGNKNKILEGKNSFINKERIKQLYNIKRSKFDLQRLIRFSEELNDNFARENFISAIILVRTILNHVSPIFDFKTFSELANNYKCEKSIKGSFQHLENSSRQIADGYLHIQARSKDVLPTSTQVNFSQDIDVLLGEIIRILQY